MYSLWNGSALSYNSCTIGFDHFLDRTKFTVPVESCSAAIFVFEQTNKCWSHFIKQFLSPDSYTHRDVTRCSLSSTSSPPLSYIALAHPSQDVNVSTESAAKTETTGNINASSTDDLRRCWQWVATGQSRPWAGVRVTAELRARSGSSWQQVTALV